MNKIKETYNFHKDTDMITYEIQLNKRRHELALGLTYRVLQAMRAFFFFSRVLAHYLLTYYFQGFVKFSSAFFTNGNVTLLHTIFV